MALVWWSTEQDVERKFFDFLQLKVALKTENRKNQQSNRAKIYDRKCFTNVSKDMFCS